MYSAVLRALIGQGRADCRRGRPCLRRGGSLCTGRASTARWRLGWRLAWRPRRSGWSDPRAGPAPTAPWARPTSRPWLKSAKTPHIFAPAKAEPGFVAARQWHVVAIPCQNPYRCGDLRQTWLRSYIWLRSPIWLRSRCPTAL